MLSILLAILPGTAVDSTFPDWKPLSQPDTSVAVPAGAKRTAHSTGSSDWVVVQEHPALRRDSTVVLEIMEHPVMGAVVWPFDHILAPTAKFLLRPVRKAVRYGERTQTIDRGLRLVHPDSVETRWFYPVATLDGSEGSAWGLTYLDQDFLARKWSFRSSGRVAVQRDVGGSLSLSLPSMAPLSQQFWGGVSASRSQAVGIRIPGMWNASDASSQGAASMERIQWSLGGAIPALKGSVLWSTFSSEWLDVGKPLRWDLELPSADTVPWLAQGDRGTFGEETDRTWSAGLNWGDQNLSGAPTSGGTVGLRGWRTWTVGGGDVAGVEATCTRYFLIGKERFVYRAEDLKPYLDLDAKEVIRILDPSTLRQRLTQRKILALHAHLVKMWEIDPSGTPASFFLFPSMGSGSPARAYPGGFLMEHAVAGISAEYRWPVWKYVDGTAFAEVAWADAGWWVPRWDLMAPGFGTGLRVRLDDRFLFRTHVSIGRVGLRYAMTSSSEF